jgi:hypothetical protein
LREAGIPARNNTLNDETATHYSSALAIATSSPASNRTGISARDKARKGKTARIRALVQRAKFQRLKNANAVARLDKNGHLSTRQ